VRSPTAAGWFGPCVLARMLGQCVADEPHGNREGVAWRTARFDSLASTSNSHRRSHGSVGLQAARIDAIAEPSDGESATTIRVRLPSGNMLQRRFAPDELVDVVCVCALLSRRLQTL